MTDARKLLRQHREELLRAGITDPWIERAKIFSVESENELKGLLRRDYLPNGLKPPAWCVPYYRLGEPQDYHLIKPDHPRRGDGGKIIKYEVPFGCPNRVFFPPEMGLADFLDSSKTLIITEGIKKSLAAASRGLLALSANGVWGWIVRREHDDDGRPIGEPELIPDLEQIVWHGREAIICFDSDAATNPKVQLAETELRRALEKRGARVVVVRLPDGGDGEKVGLDDYLLRPGKDAFLDLLSEARAAAKNTKDIGFRYSPITSVELSTADFKPEWIVQRLFVANQPAIGGGPKKTMKTSTLVDLAVSLGTGRSFLGRFEVYEPKRVAFFSGESGEFTIQETALRICAAKGVGLADVNCQWQFRLPQFSSPADLSELTDGLERDNIQVAIFDPLYLSLLAGEHGGGTEASNIFQMGPLLLNISQACVSIGCTPLLIHHTKRNLKDPFQPLDLDDLAYAGISEFARQWLLINRRTPYEPGTGHHELWMNAGGSAGQSGLWGVDIDEGVINEHFSGRHWAVSVRAAAETREAEVDANSAKADQKRDAQTYDDANLVLAKLKAKLNNCETTAGYNQIRNLAAISEGRMDRAIELLVAKGIVEECRHVSHIGKGKTTQRGCRGLRLITNSDQIPDMVSENGRCTKDQFLHAPL